MHMDIVIRHPAPVSIYSRNTPEMLIATCGEYCLIYVDTRGIFPSRRNWIHRHWLLVRIPHSTNYPSSWQLTYFCLFMCTVIVSGKNTRLAFCECQTFYFNSTQFHYSDIIMSAMSSQTTSFTIVYLTVYSGADQRKHQNSASPTFVRGIHQLPVNSRTNGQ